MLPNFIVIGAAKCGTTSLCDLLAGHAEIFFSNPKEPRYFSNEERYGDADFRESYEELFAAAAMELMVGEGTTTYTHPEIAGTVAGRIAEDIPNCKLIFMVRHPIRRLESDWRMRCYEGWAPADINAAVRENRSLITHSLFAQNLHPYLQLFPREHIHVVFLEDLAADASRTLRQCLDFLGVNTEIALDDPGRRRNDSSRFRKDSSLSAKMRESNVLARIRDHLPAAVTRVIKRLLTREMAHEPRWEKGCLDEVHTAIREDAKKFLEQSGKPVDFWEFRAR